MKKITLAEAKKLISSNVNNFKDLSKENPYWYNNNVVSSLERTTDWLANSPDYSFTEKQKTSLAVWANKYRERFC